MSDEVTIALVLAILGPGGLIAIWIVNRRDKTSKKNGDDPTVQQAQQSVINQEVNQVGLLDQWKSYSDDRISDLEKRQDLVEGQNKALQAQVRRLVRRDLGWLAHVDLLERWVNSAKPPPPPPIPPELLVSVMEVLDDSSPFITNSISNHETKGT